MLTHRGGEGVKGGYYWCRGTWRVEAVEGAHGVLPGGADRRYLPIPVLLMIPGALVLSIGFVLFLPLIGFAVLAEWLFSQVRLAVRRPVSREEAAPAPDAPTTRRG
jgi:hypothetical protein